MEKDAFFRKVEDALNGDVHKRISVPQRDMDREFHYDLQQDTTRMATLNQKYLDERAKLTLPDGQVQQLDSLGKAKLKRLGALNEPSMVKQFRVKVNLPEKTRSVGRD